MTTDTARTTLLVCETCGYDEQQPQAVRKGELLARQLELALDLRPQPALQLRRTRCLMACKRHCTVLLRAQGKTAYVIGDLAPDSIAALTLLDYSHKYQLSDNGQVAYGEWPDHIKGKFIARIPVLED